MPEQQSDEPTVPVEPAEAVEPTDIVEHAEDVQSVDAVEASEPVTSAVTVEPAEPTASFVADESLLAAHDLARAALLEITAESSIGPIAGHTVEGEHVLSLLFECTLLGYPGWHWTVTLARVDVDADPVVLEAELLPGEHALLAPEWVPWSERLAEYQAAQEVARAAEGGEGEASDDVDGDDESDVLDEDDDSDDLDDDTDLGRDFDGIDIDLHDEPSADGDADSGEDDTDDEDEAEDDIDVVAEEITEAEAASLEAAESAESAGDAED